MWLFFLPKIIVCFLPYTLTNTRLSSKPNPTTENSNFLSLLKQKIHPCCWSFIKVIIIIIIFLSCHWHGYPWPSVATPPYRSSLPADPQGYTSYPHRATVCRCELVALPLLGHVKGSIGVHYLWACPYFSNSAPHVWFV